MIDVTKENFTYQNLYNRDVMRVEIFSAQNKFLNWILQKMCNFMQMKVTDN